MVLHHRGRHAGSVRGMPSHMSRRSFLGAAGSLGLLALVPSRKLDALLAAAPGPGQAGRFLTAHELDVLRAVTARLVPRPPDDPDPRALEAKAAEAIDLLLRAFAGSPPVVHPRGPVSKPPGPRPHHLPGLLP